MRGLSGKRVIIAGGATGIGAALAGRLVDEGARLVIGDINATGLNQLVPVLAQKGAATGIVFDLGDHASIKALVSGINRAGLSLQGIRQRVA